MTDTDALDAVIPPEKMTPNVLPILVWPDDRLKEVSEPVEVFDEYLHQLMLDMFATMKAHKGVGLAAPQVGVLARIIALEIEEGRRYFFVNPEITEVDDTYMYTWDEGCLSVPGYFEERKRPQRIVVKWRDISGREHESEFHGIYAFAMQHEMDHLNGVVFVDGLSQLKKHRVQSKIRKTLRSGIRVS